MLDIFHKIDLLNSPANVFVIIFLFFFIIYYLYFIFYKKNNLNEINFNNIFFTKNIKKQEKYIKELKASIVALKYDLNELFETRELEENKSQISFIKFEIQSLEREIEKSEKILKDKKDEVLNRFKK